MMWRKHLKEGMFVEAYFSSGPGEATKWRLARIINIVECSPHGVFHTEVDVQLTKGWDDLQFNRLYRRRLAQLRRI